MSINGLQAGLMANHLSQTSESLVSNSNKLSQAELDTLAVLAKNQTQDPNHILRANEGMPLTAVMVEEFSLSFQDDLTKVDDLLKNQLAEQFSSSSFNVEEVQMPRFHPKAEDMAISYITSNYQQGLRDGKEGEELTKIIDQSAQNYRKAYNNTSSLLDKLGQLGPKQQSFISRSENRVERGLTDFTEYQMREDHAQGDKKSFELAVQTQEGDTITIRFSSAQALERGGMNYQSANSKYNTLDSFQLTYEVEGDLSEAEHKAMQTIFANVGELADDYFGAVPDYGYMFPQTSDASLSMDLLEGFDSQQLKGVDLSMSLYNTKGSDNDELNYSYEFNKQTQEQTLSVERNAFLFQPVKFDVTTSIYGGQDADQLAEYLNVIDANYDEVQAGLSSRNDKHLGTSIDMYKTALTSMFGLSDKYTQLQDKAEQSFVNGRQLVADLTNKLINTDVRYQKMSGVKDNMFKEGMSKLADFKAGFSFGDKRDSMHFFEFNQKQETSVTTQAGYQGMKQEKSYDSHTASGYGEKGLIETKKSEQYEAKAVIEKGAVVGLDQTSDAERSDKIQTQVDYGVYITKLIDSTNKASSSMRLIEDIWSQSVVHDNETKTDYKITEGTQVTYHSVKIDPDTKQKQVIIGELDKLTNRDFINKKYAPKLDSVNRFMETV